MDLKKGNGGANNNHKADFNTGTTRTPSGQMPAANTKNTACKDGPLRPSPSGKR